MKDDNSSGGKSTNGSLNLGLSELVECNVTSAAPDIDRLLDQLKAIEGQLHSNALPKALIAEQLLSLQDRIRDLGDRAPEYLLFVDIKEQLLADSNLFSLSQQIKARFDTKTERTRVPLSVLSGNGSDSSDQEKAVVRSELSDFSTLVRSFDERFKEGKAGNNSSKREPTRWLILPMTSVVALIITSLLTIVFVGYRYLFASEVKFDFLPLALSESELRSIPDSPLALPSFDPIKNVGALSSLAYDLQGTTAASNKVRVPQRTSINESSPQGRQQLTIGGQDEPAYVRELQEKPEQKVEETGIDFPPFRDSKPAPMLKAPPAIGGGHTVERFENPRSYVATVATEIMPRPSYYGSSVGALRSGEKIAVDATIGPWVRFRLNDGRQGFVLAQDVSFARN